MNRYWRDRESKHIEKMLQQHIDYEKEIHRLYLNLWDEINDEILKFYSNYAGKQNITIGEAKKAADEFDVKAFAKEAKKYVEERDFSPEANRQLKIYNLTMKANRLELLKSKLGMLLTGTTDELQNYFKNHLTDAAVNEWTRQAGILGSSVLKVEEYKRIIDSIVEASYHSATYSQRLWSNQDILKSELDRLLTKGLTAGRHPDVLSRDLRKLIVIDGLRGSETADYVARRLMLSETTRIQSEVQKRSYEKYGYEDYDFIPESTACPTCKAVAKAGPYKTADMMPGENAAPIHSWCRCSTVPYVEEEDSKDNNTKPYDPANPREIAAHLLNLAKAEEPQITKDILASNKGAGTKLVGTKFRLKTLESLTRKVTNEPTAKMRDVVRYTALSDSENMVKDVNRFIEELENRGYTISTVKNYWNNPSNPYNGINTNFLTKTNYEFELQFHTKESFDLKDGKLHDLYEKVRVLDPFKDYEEIQRINDEMWKLSNELEKPKNIDKLGGER